MTARVLIVDDDAAVLRTLTTSMSRCGYATISARNVAEAIAVVDQPDVALVDFHIGAESGLDVVRALRERLGRFVFIAMLSGEDDDDMRRRAADAGADLVLAKPVSPAELRAQIAHGLAQLRTAA